MAAQDNPFDANYNFDFLDSYLESILKHEPSDKKYSTDEESNTNNQEITDEIVADKEENAPIVAESKDVSAEDEMTKELLQDDGNDDEYSRFFTPTTAVASSQGSDSPITYKGNTSTEGLTPTAKKIIDDLASVAGDFVVTNTVRSKEENDRVGGVKNSFHLTGEAVDIRPTDSVNKFLTSREGKQFMQQRGYEIVDERKRAGHGAHWHLEPAKRKYGGANVARTKEQQFVGLNDESMDSLILPLSGRNVIRGLDSGEPVKVWNDEAEHILYGPDDTVNMEGTVHEKRVKAQAGTGRQPIYTSDKNDPRLKAYNDSLSLYKGSTADQDKMMKAFDWVKQGPSLPLREVEKVINKENPTQGWFEGDAGRLNYGKYKIEKSGPNSSAGEWEKQERLRDYKKANLKNRPIAWKPELYYGDPYEKGRLYDYDAEYAKPVQPVIYNSDPVLHKYMDKIVSTPAEHSGPSGISDPSFPDMKMGAIPDLPYRVEYDGTQHKSFADDKAGEQFMQELQSRPQGIPYGVKGYYNKKQTGGPIAPVPTKKNKYQVFYDGYLDDPAYTERLKQQGYSPDQIPGIIQKRKASVAGTQVEETTGRSNSITPGVIQVNPREGNPDEIIPHEYSHKAGSGPIEGDPALTMNQNELTLISDLMDAPKRSNEHITNPYEAKGDMDAFRYLMQDIKKPGETITQEDLDKARQLDSIKNSVIDRRLKKRFNDKNFLILLNSLASNNNTISNEA